MRHESIQLNFYYHYYYNILLLMATQLFNIARKYCLKRGGTLGQDNRDIGREKMWPLKHNSEKMEEMAEEE